MAISIRDMLEAGVHFGHQTKFWNPKMKPYIFGVRNKIHIINLDKTLTLFEDALKFIKQNISNNGSILYVGTRNQASEIIATEAKRAGQPYIDHRWLGGLLTNFATVKKSIKTLEHKEALLAKNEDSGLSKKESLDLKREVAKLQSSIGGIVNMENIPTALFIIDTGCHSIAVQEAKKLGIPIIGVVDTNNDPTQIDYVIPGNDDSVKSIQYYVSVVSDVIISAKKQAVTDLVGSMSVNITPQEDVSPKIKTVKKVKVAKNEEDIAVSIIKDAMTDNKISDVANYKNVTKK
jgi:small subunit ribosomal protein S2